MDIHKDGKVVESTGEQAVSEPSGAEGIPSASLNVGDVLGRSFGILGKKPDIFFGLALLAALPTFFLSLGVTLSEEMDIVTGIVDLVFSFAVQGATAYAVYQIMREDTVSFGESVTRGMARLFPLAAAALLIGICTALGLLLFVVPGLIVWCLWFVSIPACVVERLGPIRSMSRSAELTRGYRWPIFGLVLIVGIVDALLSLGTTVFDRASPDNALLVAMLTALGSMVIQAVENVVAAVVYFALRAIKDGMGVDSLVNVFD